MRCKVCDEKIRTMCFKDKELGPVCGELHRKVLVGEMTEDEAKRHRVLSGPDDRLAELRV